MRRPFNISGLHMLLKDGLHCWKTLPKAVGSMLRRMLASCSQQGQQQLVPSRKCKAYYSCGLGATVLAQPHQSLCHKIKMFSMTLKILAAEQYITEKYSWHGESSPEILHYLNTARFLSLQLPITSATWMGVLWQLSSRTAWNIFAVVSAYCTMRSHR